MAKIISEENAEQLMRQIGACKEGVNIMLPKTKHRLVLLEGVRNAIANIIKQEMLSVGGDAAVSAGCVGCKVEKTDVLLIGNLSQYKIFVEKMKKQVSESKKIAEEVEQTLWNAKKLKTL